MFRADVDFFQRVASSQHECFQATVLELVWFDWHRHSQPKEGAEIPGGRRPVRPVATFPTSALPAPNAKSLPTCRPDLLFGVT